MQELLTCTVAVGANPLPQEKVKEIIGIDIFILFVSEFCIR